MHDKTLPFYRPKYKLKNIKICFTYGLVRKENCLYINYNGIKALSENLKYIPKLENLNLGNY